MLDLYMVADSEYGYHIMLTSIYGEYSWFDDRDEIIEIVRDINVAYKKANDNEEFEKYLGDIYKLKKLKGDNYD